MIPLIAGNSPTSRTGDNQQLRSNLVVLIKDNIMINDVEEIWKVIEDEPLYEVSNYGKVRNIKTKRIKSLRHDRYGYLRVTLYPSGKTYTIHRLVMLTFDPYGTAKDKNQVNHIDGDKENNFIGNLEWCTVKENCIHRSRVLKVGIRRGEDNPSAKITNDTARKIKYGNFAGLNNREIGDLFGVSDEVVRKIRSNLAWKHI